MLRNTSNIFVNHSQSGILGSLGHVGQLVQDRSLTTDSAGNVLRHKVEPVRNKELLKSGSSLIGWTLVNNSGATATMAMDNTSPLGKPAMKITIPDDTGNVDVTLTGAGLTGFTSKIGKIVVQLYTLNELGIKQIRLYAGTTSLARNMDRTYNVSNNNYYRSNGHYIVDLHAGNATANTLLDSDEVDTIRLRLNGQAIGGTLWLEGVYMVDSVRDNWLINTFDDADISMYTQLYPLMRERNLAFTLNVNWDDVGTNNALYVTAAQLDEMYTYGADVTSHNRTNTAYASTTPPTAQPADSVRLAYCEAYRYCRQQLLARGYNRAMGFHALVQGAHDGALIDALKSYGVVLCRNANNRGNVEPTNLHQQSVLPQRSLGSGSSLNDAIEWLTTAKRYKQDVMSMGHILAETSANSVTWARSNMETFIDTALAMGFKVGSVSQWANARGLAL